MESRYANQWTSFCSSGRLSALIFSIILSFLLCCNSPASRGGTPADSNQLSSGGQMTQNEAERSALAEFAKHSPHTVVESYVFEKLIHMPNKRPDMGLSGYFLCGHIEFVFARKTYGPLRIMVNWSNEKILVLILYDDPERGRHVASSTCTLVEQVDSNR